MDSSQEFREYLEEFRVQMEQLRQLHQQTVAVRFMYSLQQKAEPAQPPKNPGHIMLMQARRLTSRRLHALATVIDPDKVTPVQQAASKMELDGVCHVVEERREQSEEAQKPE